MVYLDRLEGSVGGSSCCGAGYTVFKGLVCFGLLPVLSFSSAFRRVKGAALKLTKCCATFIEFIFFYSIFKPKRTEPQSFTLCGIV